MGKIKLLAAYLMILLLVLLPSTMKAQNFDPEDISQVSKGIAEWKLLNENKSETQVEETIYVSSSLSGMVEKGSGEGVSVVGGLVAFDNGYWINSEIRQWELNNGSKISSGYAARLPSPSTAAVSIGGWVTTRTIGQIYRSMGGTFQDIANVYRAAQGLPPSYEVLRSTAMGSQVWGTATQITSAGITFMKTIDRVGTSMQVMNPPIYLQNNPGKGMYAEKTSWGWIGKGSYSIPEGHVYYQEILKTAGPGPITRTHTDWAVTNTGNYVRQVEIKTPVTSGFERFMMYHYPPGNYFDPKTSTITTTTRIQQSFRVETVGGMTNVTPLPSSGIGNWNILQGIRLSTVAPTYRLTVPTYTLTMPYTLPMPTIKPVTVPFPLGR